MLLHPVEQQFPGFELEELIQAQEKSWQVLRTAATRIVPGMTVKGATDQVLKIMTDAGSPRFWHKILVRFGAETCKVFSDPSNPDLVLRDGDAFFIDIGPTWMIKGREYEGDVGDTFVAGGDSGDRNEKEQCVHAARELFIKGRDRWLTGQVTGQGLYAFLKFESEKLGYELVMETDGHRVGMFPHKRITSSGLTEIDFVPTSGAWILEIQLRHPSGEFGAFYEDLLITP